MFALENDKSRGAYLQIQKKIVKLCTFFYTSIKYKDDNVEYHLLNN